MGTATTEVAQATAPLNHLELLERPEVQEALSTLRTALERLHAEYAPIVAEARELPGQAELIDVRDQEEFELANAWAREIAIPVRDLGKGVIDPYVAAGNVFHKAMTSLRRLVTDPVEEAIRKIDARCIAWTQAQDRIRREAEEQARRERERLEREAREREAEARRRAEADAEAERKRLAKIAEEAQRSGDEEAAAAIREQAAEVRPVEPELALPEIPPPAVAIPEKPKADGVAVRKNYKARLRNMRALVRFVAGRAEHEGLLQLNQSAADKLAKAYEDRLGEVVPGLEAYNDAGIARRRR